MLLIIVIFLLGVMYIFLGRGNSEQTPNTAYPDASSAADSGVGSLLSGTIAKSEGSSALGFRLNNPLNLRFKKSNDWQGQIGSEKGFCVFTSPEYGIRAAMRTLVSYRKAGVVTVQGIINRWAPPTENNTSSYVKHVCERTGWTKDREVYQTANDYITLLKAMCVSEIGSQPFNDEIWLRAAQLANI